jgi:hypothetical protein
MSLRDTITPDTISAILAKANPQYRYAHEVSVENYPHIAACTLGRVFADRLGDLCVYTGIGRDRKFPVQFTRLHDCAPKKGDQSYFARISNSKY